MERLTQTTEERALLGIEYPTYLSPEMCKAYDERLKAYEDTGLTPEEIERIVDAYGRGHTLRSESALRLEMIRDIETDQLRELAQAEKEGRLVVLPCKVGDEIYRIIKPSGVYKPFVSTLPDKVEPFGIYYKNLIGAYSYIPFDELGKTVFLTREEAEAALKGEGNG